MIKPHWTRLLAAKFILDGALLAAVLFGLSPALTGLAIHEWLGIALIGAVLAHLLLNWAWIVAALRRFLRALTIHVRIDAVLNAALFAAMTMVIASGLIISEVALPFLGLDVRRNTLLSIVHLVSADVLLILVGLHLGMNWKWVVLAVRKQILTPLQRRLAPHARTTTRAAASGDGTGK